MTDERVGREWNVADFTRYKELHHRNYVLDDLWPNDASICPPEMIEFIELEQFYRGTDNTQILLDQLARAREVIEFIKSKEQQSFMECTEQEEIYSRVNAYLDEGKKNDRSPKD